MIARACLPALFAVVLTGCGSPTQVLLTPATSELRVSPAISSLVVRDLSLPLYAASDAPVILNADGTVGELSGTVWADTPERALTLQLAADLSVITGARVAAEPWPFSSSPAAEVTVRVERFLGQADGQFRMTGQYAIAPIDSGLSDRSGRFDIVVPMPGATAGAVAGAQGRAISQLAETIARRIAR
jgi:uncharacterized lipoprotein YmbA